MFQYCFRMMKRHNLKTFSLKLLKHFDFPFLQGDKMQVRYKHYNDCLFINTSLFWFKEKFKKILTILCQVAMLFCL